MRKNSKGLTLVEIMLATAVAMVVGVILLAILVNQTGVFNQQNALINQGLSLNDSLRVISDDIRLSSKIAPGYPEVSPLYQSSPTTLVLQLQSVDNTGATIASVFDYVVITPDSNPKILRRKVFPDPLSSRTSMNQVMTTILNSISFAYLDASGQTVDPTQAVKVNISLSVLGKPGIGGATRSASTTTGLRNSL